MEQRGIQEFLLPLGIVLVVGMIIFPLPPTVLDLCLASNIAFSLLLLLATIYSVAPESFTTLPSLLLLSTLFRLGLNISTTRQLLTTGEAPQVVSGFGDFVVGGNILVGGVLFLIVTLVQFLVVSKGAERVAEVAARFALDAMPGKQMAIDADIRAGILSLGEAKERRRELQRESKLFGALDGAMKFIKGDAIAGLCIAFVNILAGFLVGVLQLGLSVSEALDRFTLFTIGDSLVSQIPALLVAVAAGVAVTRVAESEGGTMASELVHQLTDNPKVLLTTSVVLSALGFAPGLPGFPFWGLGALASLLHFRRNAEEGRKKLAQREAVFIPRAPSALLLSLGRSAQGRLVEEGGLPLGISQLRKEVFENRGLLIPEPEWEISRAEDEGWFGFLVEGGLVAEGTLKDVPTGEGTAEVLRVFSRYCQENLRTFLSDTQTRMLLDLHLPTSEDLINNLLPKHISVTTLTRVFLDLLDEGLSIRNLRSILQAIAENCQNAGDLEYPLSEGRYLLLLSAVRRGLRQQFSLLLPRVEGRIQLYELSSQVDRLLSQCLLTSSPIAPSLQEKTLEEFERLSGECPQAVVLSTSHSRHLLGKMLSRVGRPVWVVSPEELPDDLPVVMRGEFLGELSELASVRRAA